MDFMKDEDLRYKILSGREGTEENLNIVFVRMRFCLFIPCIIL